MTVIVREMKRGSFWLSNRLSIAPIRFEFVAGFLEEAMRNCKEEDNNALLGA